MEVMEQPLEQTNAVFVYEYEEKKLKHLDFVEATVENMVVFLRKLYELSKEHSGPFKARVEVIEEFMLRIFGPVCDKFHHVPLQLLEFLDLKDMNGLIGGPFVQFSPKTCMQEAENIQVYQRRTYTLSLVDEFIHEIDWRQEPLPKLMTHVTKKAAEVTRELAMEIQATGLLDATANAAKEAYLTSKPVAKDMIIKYEPVAEEYAVWAWQLCKQVPILSQVSQLMVPTAAFWAERYNKVVDFTAESGLPMAHYLPLIPLEKIAKVFAEEADENGFRYVSGDQMTVAY